MKGDFKGSRRADFFLKEYNIYIEYLGGWDKKDPEEREKERKRYNEKKAIYELNNIKCIWIFPVQLNYVSNVIKRELEKLSGKVEPLPFYKDALIISVLLTIIFCLLTILSSLFLYLVLVCIILIIIFASTRCPNCKRVFAKKHVSRDFSRIEKRPWKYQIETRYLYSDGTYKNSTYSEWKIINERIKIYRNVKECKYCDFKWPEKEEVNLDKATRPQTVYTRRTNYRNPATQTMGN